MVSVISERIRERRIWRDAVAYLERRNFYFLLASALEVLDGIFI